MKHEDVIVGIVTYNPNITQLRDLIFSNINSGYRVIVCDNGSKNQDKIGALLRNCEELEFIFLSENLGIAMAQNKIVDMALRSSHVKFICFYDQDSKPKPGQIECLLHELKAYTLQNQENVFCIGPKYRDLNRGICSRPSLNIFRRKNNLFYLSEETRPVSHIISSGMLLNLNSPRDSLYTDEQLFIDWVDTELCWRAILKYDLVVLQTGKVEMDHYIGGTIKTLFGRPITMHNNLRSFYKIRNGVYLIKRYWRNRFALKHILLHTIKNCCFTFLNDGPFYYKIKVVLSSLSAGIKLPLSGKGLIK